MYNRQSKQFASMSSANAALEHVMGFAHQLENLAVHVNESIHSNAIGMDVGGNTYHPTSDSLVSVGDVRCDQGQGVLAAGCGKLAQ